MVLLFPSSSDFAPLLTIHQNNQQGSGQTMWLPNPQLYLLTVHILQRPPLQKLWCGVDQMEVKRTVTRHSHLLSTRGPFVTYYFLNPQRRMGRAPIISGYRGHRRVANESKEPTGRPKSRFFFYMNGKGGDGQSNGGAAALREAIPTDGWWSNSGGLGQ